jgi:phosphoribosylanthranilate isomerase
MGFIWVAKSPRYVGPDFVIPTLPANTKAVGVFVNETTDHIIALSKKAGFSVVQLHGDESPEFCKEIKSVVKTTKAFLIGDSTSFGNINAYSDVVDCFLFDTLGERYGGTGKQFDWNLLTSFEINKPFFLSGGIGSDDVNKIDEICNRVTSIYALDLNSKFEITPGIKDMDKLATFLSSIYKK